MMKMVQRQSATVIRFKNEHRDEDSAVTVSLKRAFQRNPRGRDYASLRTGPWQVDVDCGGVCNSDSQLPVDAARLVAEAILAAATEAEALNATEPPVEPVAN